MNKSNDMQLGFLLSQVGSFAAIRFAELVKPLGLTPAQAGILRLIARQEGLNQKDLATQLSILPSRLVVLIDELEEKLWVKRNADPEDRRSTALVLTDAGRAIYAEVGQLARAHSESMSAGLTADERQVLTGLLARIAAQQQLKAGVHPGLSRR